MKQPRAAARTHAPVTPSSSHGEVVTAPLHGQPRRRAVGHGRFDGGAGGDTASATTREPRRARLLVGASRQPPDARRPRRRCRDCWHSNPGSVGSPSKVARGFRPVPMDCKCSSSRGPAFPAAPSSRPAPRSSSEPTFALIGRASVTRSSWTPRRRATSRRKPRSSARCAPRVGDPGYELDELAALGALAVDAILRDDGKRGAAVAPPREVSAAPGELPVTLIPRGRRYDQRYVRREQRSYR